MTLADERLRELDKPSLTINERVPLCCFIPLDLFHVGRCEAVSGSVELRRSGKDLALRIES